MTTVRFLGVFLDDPTDVPPEVVDYLAEQLGVVDASTLKAYGERENSGSGTFSPAGGFRPGRRSGER